MATHFFQGNKFLNPPGAELVQRNARVDYFSPPSQQEAKHKAEVRVGIDPEEYWAIDKGGDIVYIKVDYDMDRKGRKAVMNVKNIFTGQISRSEFHDIIDLINIKKVFRQLPDEILHRMHITRGGKI